MDTHNRWVVYGSALNEGFDPLQYSKAVGDYVPGGTSFGGRWMSAVDFVEMREGKNVVKIKPPSSEV